MAYLCSECGAYWGCGHKAAQEGLRKHVTSQADVNALFGAGPDGWFAERLDRELAELGKEQPVGYSGAEITAENIAAASKAYLESAEPQLGDDLLEYFRAESQKMRQS